MNKGSILTSRLTGRCAVVTGAGDGIGRGIALRLAKEGAAVIVAELDADAGARVVEEIRSIKGSATFLATDVTDKASVRAMMDAAGAVDIVVNNAWAGGGVGGLNARPTLTLNALSIWGRWRASGPCKRHFRICRRKAGGG